jgi:hypothetical protein
MTKTDNPPSNSSSTGTTRRTVLRAGAHAAWMVPAIQIATQVPAMAVSGKNLFTINPGASAAIDRGGYHDLMFSGFTITAGDTAPTGPPSLIITFVPAAPSTDQVLYVYSGGPDGFSTLSQETTLVATYVYGATPSADQVIPVGGRNAGGGLGVFVGTDNDPAGYFLVTGEAAGYQTTSVSFSTTPAAHVTARTADRRTRPGRS